MNPSPMIEVFAKQTVADLGVPREFEGIICAEMRRQIYFHEFRAAYDEAAAWDRGVLLYNYWMEQLPASGAVRPTDTISAFQPTLRPVSESGSRFAATSVQETLRNALPASAPGRSALEDAVAAQTSSDPRRIVPLTLSQAKRPTPTVYTADPITTEQQTLYSAELQHIMGPLNRKAGRFLYANVDLFNLDPPAPVVIREYHSNEREPFNPNKPLNFDILQFDLEGQPSWMRPRDPNSGRFLTKKEIEILRKKALEAKENGTYQFGDNAVPPREPTPPPPPPPPPVEMPAPAPVTKGAKGDKDKETPKKKKKAPSKPRTPKVTAAAASAPGTPAADSASASASASSEKPRARGRPPKRKNTDDAGLATGNVIESSPSKRAATASAVAANSTQQTLPVMMSMGGPMPMPFPPGLPLGLPNQPFPPVAFPPQAFPPQVFPPQSFPPPQ